MSELAREIIPIAFMFGVAVLLAPLVGFTMYMAFDGDRLRTDEDSAAGTLHAHRATGAEQAPRDIATTAA